MVLLLLACTGEKAGTGTAISTEGFFVADEGRPREGSALSSWNAYGQVQVNSLTLMIVASSGLIVSMWYSRSDSPL